MVDQAKRERSKAKGTMTRANKRVISAIEDKFDREIIQGRFETASKKWEVVMEKNEEYIQLKYEEQDQAVPQVEEDWYDEVAAAFEEVEIKYHEYMKSMKGGESRDEERGAGIEKGKEIKEKENDQLVFSKRMHEFEKKTMSSMLRELEGVITNLKSTETVIKAYQEDVKTQLLKLRSSQREVVMRGAETDIDVLEGEFAKMVIEVGRRVEEMRNTKETKGKCQMKLDRVKLPSFSGAIREYPRFKKDFESQVEPNIERDAIPYVLKSCLSGEALEVVKNVDDDAVKMWERLKEKYGRPSKVTDAIMFEIKGMKQINEGDDRKFAEVVDLVESSWRDLRMIGMESEISNTTVVSFIEEKLPRSIKAQWCLEVCENEKDEESGSNKISNDKGKFDVFLKFLLKHKRAMEYGAEQIRVSCPQKMGQTHVLQGQESNSSKENCWIHTGIPAGLHPIWKCREFLAKTVKDRIKLVQEYDACRACLLKRCPGAKDPNLCKSAFKCFETGCRQPHNQLLHERKEIVGSAMHAGSSSSGQETMLPLQKI